MVVAFLGMPRLQWLFRVGGPVNRTDDIFFSREEGRIGGKAVELLV